MVVNNIQSSYWRQDLNNLKKSIISRRYSVNLIALLFYSLIALTISIETSAQIKPQEIIVGEGWANNSINAVSFRKNSLTSFKGYQYISYYDINRYVILGRRKIGDKKWVLNKTSFRGNAADAHNTISIMIDGDGYLHMAWDHHNNKLRYARSVQPVSLVMSEQVPMTGKAENSVSYPEFHKLPNGDLLFFYRDGGSGRGNLVINRYQLSSKSWTQLHSNLLDGEGKRNAYWQACVDKSGTIYISWVWRESPDVASNHDLGFACSKDGGVSWQRSTGEEYTLPITASTAEYALRIPQKSELINQTSMVADDQGNPFIASYWRAENDSIPQYHIVYRLNQQWEAFSLDFRTTPFSLSGAGSKKIPIARPQILVKGSGDKASVLLVFRDQERGDKVSVAKISNISKGEWQLIDLSPTSVGSWEPTYDIELWKERAVLNLFVQNVEQVDGEGKADIPAQMVRVLEWKPHF